MITPGEPRSSAPLGVAGIGRGDGDSLRARVWLAQRVAAKAVKDDAVALQTTHRAGSRMMTGRFRARAYRIVAQVPLRIVSSRETGAAIRISQASTMA